MTAHLLATGRIDAGQLSIDYNDDDFDTDDPDLWRKWQIEDEL